MRSRASNVIAGCFAMAAFAVAIVAGVAGGNATTSILARALMAMVVCYPVGLVIGLICERVAVDQVRAHCARHPVPQPAVDGASGDSAQASTREDASVT